MAVDANNREEMRNIDKTYELPTGEVFTVKEERHLCAEPLFQPSLLGIESPGIHELIFNSIINCDQEIQNDMFANIILSGGSMSFPNMAERLKKELTQLAPANTKIGITVSQGNDSKYSVWRGGAAFVNLPCFHQMWIDGDEYSEVGPSIAHIKSYG